MSLEIVYEFGIREQYEKQNNLVISDGTNTRSGHKLIFSSAKPQLMFYLATES